MGYLGENDLISGMVFEKKVKVLAKLSIRDSLFGDEYDDSISQTSQVKS